MKWIPILICMHSHLCTGAPIVGKAVGSYDECQDVLGLALQLYAEDARRNGVPELGTDEFMKRYIVTKCERSE